MGGNLRRGEESFVRTGLDVVGIVGARWPSEHSTRELGPPPSKRLTRFSPGARPDRRLMGCTGRPLPDLDTAAIAAVRAPECRI
jgi:hypothetical protein